MSVHEEEMIVNILYCMVCGDIQPLGWVGGEKSFGIKEFVRSRADTPAIKQDYIERGHTSHRNSANCRHIENTSILQENEGQCALRTVNLSKVRVLTS